VTQIPVRALALVLALLVPPAAPAIGAEPALRFEGRFIQGGLVIGFAEPGISATLDGRAVPVAADGTFVFGFGRDAPPAAELVLHHPDGREQRQHLAVEARRYDIQRIDGLPPRMVTPSKADLERIQAEQKLINKARARRVGEPLLLSGFIWPATGRISGVYGSQRILNGKPRNPHVGVDIAAPEGTLVVAPADGIVTLTHPDMYYTGRTVILHHGLGVSSFLIHMSAILVEEGQRVRQGDPIGRVGMTGRATGPHLHWGMNWADARLDPQLLLGPMPAAPQSSGRQQSGQ